MRVSLPHVPASPSCGQRYSRVRRHVALLLDERKRTRLSSKGHGMASTTPMEVNGNAGSVGTNYSFTLNSRNDRIRVHAAPARTATVTNVGGGVLRQAT